MERVRSGGDHLPAAWCGRWLGDRFIDPRNFTGTGTTVFLGVEVANDPRTPDSGYTSLWAAGATANGMKDPDSTAVSLSLAGKLWYRFVWVIYVTSGNGWVTVGGGFAEVLDP